MFGQLHQIQLITSREYSSLSLSFEIFFEIINQINNFFCLIKVVKSIHCILFVVLGFNIFSRILIFDRYYLILKIVIPY
jgi:hypothetical protein